LAANTMDCHSPHLRLHCKSFKNFFLSFLDLMLPRATGVYSSTASSSAPPLCPARAVSSQKRTQPSSPLASSTPWHLTLPSCFSAHTRYVSFFSYTNIVRGKLNAITPPALRRHGRRRRYRPWSRTSREHALCRRADLLPHRVSLERKVQTLPS
jgi:hypothetical protein